MDSFPIPEAAFDEDAIILAKKGAGKTVLAKDLVERSLDAGERTLIIDPKGDWWGLKSSADGKSDGYPVAVFGGQHGDMEFTPSNAEPLARMLANDNLPSIIDTSSLTLKERGAALTSFYRALYRHNRQSLFLVQDEVHQLAPQTPSGTEAYELKEIISTIVTLGRQRGFRLLSICQRVQLVDKTLVTQADTLIAMRLVHKRDKAPALDWFSGNAPDEFVALAKEKMGRLDVGQALVGCANLELFDLVRVPMNRTFDSSATPKRGEVQIEPSTLATADLSAVREALQANDAEPEVALSPDFSKDIARQISDARKEGYAKGFAEAERGKDKAHTDGIALGWRQARDAMHGALDRLKPEKAPALPPSKKGPAPAVTENRPRAASKNALPGITFTGPQRRVVDAISFWRGFGFDTPSRAQVAFVARYTYGGSSLKAALSSLRKIDVVNYPQPDHVSLGLDWPVPQASFDRLTSELSGPQSKALKPLLSGDTLSRAELAEATGYENGGSSLKAALSSLRTLGLIDYPSPGCVTAEPWLVALHQAETAP